MCSNKENVLWRILKSGECHSTLGPTECLTSIFWFLAIGSSHIFAEYQLTHLKMFATISGDYGYSAEEAQSQRDALIAPEITLRDVLDQFRAFADEFENFDIEEFEEEHCGNTAHTLENLTLHSEDTNPHLNRITSHMASTLDDAALNLGNVGSQLQDVDSRSDEVALPLDGTTSPADDRESYRDIDSSSDGTVSSSDEMAAAYVEMASVLNDLDVDFDDDSSSDEEGLFSDKGDLSIVQKNIVTRTELPPPAQQLMWMQQIDTDGSIVGLITEDLDFHIAYEFYLPPDGRMPLEVLTYFSDVISTLRNLTKVMFEFLTTMSDIHSDDSRIMWLPALLRCGIRDIIQELV